MESQKCMGGARDTWPSLSAAQISEHLIGWSKLIWILRYYALSTFTAGSHALTYFLHRASKWQVFVCTWTVSAWQLNKRRRQDAIFLRQHANPSQLD